MDLVQSPQDPFPQDVQLAQGLIAPQGLPGPEDVDMEITEHPESPSSIWGHHLRQNIRNRLLQRGVDIELIDGPEGHPTQVPMLPQDVPLPEDDGMDVVEIDEGSLPWAQDVKMWPRMLLQRVGSQKPGICKLCTRAVNITRHHVHPRVGRRSQRRPPPGITDGSQQYLNTTIDLCRPCHSMVHYIIPNQLMSDSYYSLPLLASHPRVKAWVSWVRRQRIPSPRLFGISKTTKGINLVETAGRVKRKQKHTKLNINDIRDALAQLWKDNRNDIPRLFGDVRSLVKKLSELTDGGKAPHKTLRKAMSCSFEYQAWCKSVFPSPADVRFGDKWMRRVRLMDKRKEMRTREGMTSMIRDALDTIWRRHGNSFPKFLGDPSRRSQALQETVRACILEAANVSTWSWFGVTELQRTMQLDARYRKWLEWTYPNVNWVHRTQTVTQSGAVGEHKDDENGSEITAQTYGTGTGSRTDPIVFDLTDDEKEANSPNGRGNVTVTPSGRVVIDLTIVDDEVVEIGQGQGADGSGNLRPGFFFDVGGGQTHSGKFFNV